MYHQRYSSFLSLLAASSLLGNAAARALQPISFETEPSLSKRGSGMTLRPVSFETVHGIEKRDDSSALDLKNMEHFYWGGNGADSSTYANLTTWFEAEDAHVIAMDKFAGMLKNVQCMPNMGMMDIEFKHHSDYRRAKSTWDWVNNKQANHFVLVANYPGCGADGQRQPYFVTKMTEDDKKNTVHLTAEEKPWKQVLPKWYVRANSRGINSPDHTSLHKRISKDVSIDLTSDFSKDIFNTDVSGLNIDVACSDCGTSGSLDFDFEVAGGDLFKGQNPFSIQQASITVTPNSIAAFMTIEVTASGTLAQGFETDIPVINIPIGGINIPGVLDIGPTFGVDVGASFSDWTGEAKASYGARLDVPTDSVAKLDFLDQANNEFNGWAPTFTSTGPSLSATISAHAEVFAKASIALTAEAFGFGFEAGLDLKLPDLNVDFAATASTDGGACNTNQPFGIEITGDLGVDLEISASKVGEAPFFTAPLFQKSFPLFDVCLPFGDPISATSSAVPQASSTPTQSLPPAASTPAASAVPTPVGNSTAGYRMVKPRTGSVRVFHA
jgi:hypothetical protein